MTKSDKTPRTPEEIVAGLVSEDYNPEVVLASFSETCADDSCEDGDDKNDGKPDFLKKKADAKKGGKSAKFGGKQAPPFGKKK